MKRFFHKDKIRVLHVASTSTGGVGYNLLMLARYLNKPDIELYFAIPPDSSFYNQILKEGGTIFPLNISRKPFKLKNLKAFYDLWRIIKSKKFEIVHTHTSVGGFIGRFAAKMGKAPFIVWSIHGWAFDYPYGSFLGKKFFKALELLLSCVTDHYVAISEIMKRVGVMAGIMSPEKIDVIYHGIEIDKRAQDDSPAVKKMLGIGADCLVIGSVGRFEPPKAMDDLLNAVSLVKKSHPNIKLILVGDGPLRRSLEELSVRLGIKEDVIFTGWQENVKSYIGCMDVFCLPSNYESFGIVLLESMVAGKPIVATRVGGIPELVVNGKGGLLVLPSRPTELAKSICLLLCDTELRKQMGHYNKKRVQQVFNVKGMVQQYEMLYRGITKNA